MDEKKLNEVMGRFVHEVRRKDGNEYPPSSLICIVSAVQRYLQENGRPAVCFYDDKNSTYDMLRKILDAKLKLLTSKGIGSHRNNNNPYHLKWKINCGRRRYLVGKQGKH